jgi:hypothetical protein
MRWWYLDYAYITILCIGQGGAQISNPGAGERVERQTGWRTRYRTVAVKSMQHFSAAVEPVARDVVLVNAGAPCLAIHTPELFTRVGLMPSEVN